MKVFIFANELNYQKKEVVEMSTYLNEFNESEN
jgi:hypothetical protein